MRKQDNQNEMVNMRVQRIQKEMVGNEALGGASLDESGASELLSWGLKSAEGIAYATKDLDDESAELSMAERLKALRKMMKHLGRLLGEGKDLDAEGRLWLWDSVQKQARSLYGEHLQFPDVNDLLERLSQGEAPGQVIASLREMFEKQQS